MLENATSPLKDGRDIVIFPAGATWGFHLPAQHTITVNEGIGLVYLSTPDHGSGYHLAGVEENEGEVRVKIGAPTENAHAVGTGHVPALRAYSFPQIQDELDRLKAELIKHGGSGQEADAWGQGSSHDSHTTRLRARIRDLRAAAESNQ